MKPRKYKMTWENAFQKEFNQTCQILEAILERNTKERYDNLCKEYDKLSWYKKLFRNNPRRCGL